MFTALDLPYAYNALEPTIDEETMHLHHDKHYVGYVNNLNAALADSPEFLQIPLEELLRNLDKVPENIRTKVRNNAGGDGNHTMFWFIMSPDGGGEPGGDIAEAINQDFGDFATFKEQFSQAAASVFGSGWAWLVWNDGKLSIMTTPNQDSPLMQNIQPVMGLDVWEHAYYLKYHNVRADYISAWWNVVNWKEIDQRFSKAREGNYFI